MDNKYVHFIGIGGISMSGLAQILMYNNVKVSGSDIADSRLLSQLKAQGAEISIGHSAKNITNPDLVVYTAAIADDNPELLEAKRKGIETVERATLLGNLMKCYKTAIAVAGTHGKTTTTSILAHVLLEANTDPTIMVGGELSAIGGNLRTGSKDYFLTEACEYHRSFLKFFPTIGIILNIEADHLDYFKDINEIIDTFSDFAAIIPPDGALIVANDNENNVKAAKSAKCKVITIGLQNADYTARNIIFNQNFCAQFDIFNNNDKICNISLNIKGKHNIYNSLCAFACALQMGIDPQVIKAGIESFGGIKRRFEKKGEVDGIIIIDDYAHHPTEIKATLKTAKKLSKGTLWCIFQPHTYTRTQALFDDFSKALSYADRIIITDIYAAREKDPGTISAKDLSDITENSIYIKSFDDIEKYIKQNAKNSDVVITMGAGDVYKIGESLLNNL